MQLPVVDSMESTQTALRGNAFIERFAAVFAGNRPPPRPLDDAQHQNILIPQMVGGELHWAVFGFLGVALELRGAKVTATVCDAALPACVHRKIDHHEPACTRWCLANAAPLAKAAGFRTLWHSQLIEPAIKAELAAIVQRTPPESIPEFVYKDIPVGSLVPESVENALKVAGFTLSNPTMRRSAYEFLLSGLMLVEIYERVIREHQIDKVVSDSGFLIDWGIPRLVARKHGIPVDVFNVGLRGQSIKSESDRPGFEPQTVPGWNRWRHEPLTPEQSHRLGTYLSRREVVPYEFKGEQWRGRISDDARVREILTLTETRDGLTFCMFPNVGFDAGKTAARPAFGAASDWVLETIAFFARHPRHRLIVKIHPGELHRAALDPLADQIAARFRELPSNVRIIPPDSGITAHSVLRLSDAALVYTSTVAAEAAALGKPVVLTGGGRHAGRGVTTDIASPEDYWALLTSCFRTNTPPPCDPELGRRYGYAVFFRADVPITHFRMLDVGVSRLEVENIRALAPGQPETDAAIDHLCNAILRAEALDGEQLLAA